MEEKKKTLTERMLEETLSDNTQVETCKQCKNCLFKSDGTVWSNKYNKSYCRIYQYPRIKPLYVINNERTCEYYHNENEEDDEE